MRRRGLQGSSNGIKIDFDGELLCFTAVENCQFSFTNDIYYSTDQEKWELLPKNNYTSTISIGGKIWWYANLIKDTWDRIGTFSSTGGFNVSGNPRCLLVNNELVDYSFYRLFSNCINLIDASGLILDSTTLIDHCYCFMFEGCTSLIQGPKLTATTLADSCYYAMFTGCKNLTTAPELLVTTLAINCYNSMFDSCTSLTSAPKLPATTLANSCYSYMFRGCTNLTTAPELPATTLAEGCYQYMFRNCSSLTTAPELPATILTNSCYYYMFYGCSKLNYVKSHATKISALYCLTNWLSGVSSNGDFYGVEGVPYSESGSFGIPSGWTRHNIDYLEFEVLEPSSFSFTNDVEYKVNDGVWNILNKNTNTSTFNTGDKIYWRGSLTPTTINGTGNFSSTGKFNVSGNPKELLKDKKLVSYNFYGLFNGCVNLVDASGLILDSTTLTRGCYCSMFNGCKSLTKAPELPATNLASFCYEYMFVNCTCLTEAPELPATTLTSYCYELMFYGCSKLNYVKSYATDISAMGCLNDWLDGVSITGNFYKPSDIDYPEGPSGIPSGWTKHNIEYLTFEVLEPSSFSFTNDIEYKVNNGEWSILNKNTNTAPFNTGDKIYWRGKLTPNSSNGIGTFSSTGKFNVSGNPKELLKNNELMNYNFLRLFMNCINLVDASGLILDSTILSNYCYCEMFSDCIGLTKAPKLPAATLVYSCYKAMFSGCTSLTASPELLATTLANDCYYEMFKGCTSLTQAPELPATTLAWYCYGNMFKGCSKLNYVKSYATNINANNCLINWLSGVSNKGEFHKPSSTIYDEGASGIPKDWTVYEF